MKEFIDIEKADLDKRNRLVKFLYILSLCSFASYALFYLIYDPYLFKEPILFIGGVLAINYFALVLFNKKYYDLSKYIMIFSLTIAMSVLCFIEFGKAAQLHVYFFLFGLIPIGLWSRPNKIAIYLYFLFNIILFYLIEFDCVCIVPRVQFPETLSKPFFLIASFTTFNVILLTLWSFFRSNEEKSLKLIEYSQVLHKNNGQIEQQRQDLEQLNCELEASLQNISKKQTQLKEANRTNNRMFSIIAHDIKGPLSSIIGLVQLLHLKIDNMDMDKIKHFISNIHGLSNRLHELTTNLLYWSRAQLNTISVTKIPILLHEIVENGISLYRQDLQHKDIEIQNNIDSTLRIMFDSEMAHAIIRNLLSNAIKFTESGGNIKFNVEKKEDSVLFSVSDSGIGMSQEQLENLFEENTITSTAGTNKEKGTGLGLLICHEFLKLNNCNIKVDSNIGTGTTFTIEFVAAE